ncbi:MAG TPA: HAD hydrolase-like protein [Spirochaetota bacterium]|nr:HAD hydrolase-like protein [Spirochaetota bacterium]HPQ53625.1 HAD hydrolase-like protein [Spirochaetota bacterium]
MNHFTDILFDLDGTISDSREGIMLSAAYALEKMHITEKDKERLKRFAGPPLHDSFRNIYGLEGADTDMAIELYREHYGETGMFRCAPYPGIPDLLETLHLEGKRLYIATSKLESFARKVIEYLGMEKYFTIIAGSNDDGSRAKKPEVIGYLLAQIPGLKKENTAMVGDMRFDILGAREQGLHAIGVSYGYGTVEELKEAGAALIAGNAGELASLLL